VPGTMPAPAASAVAVPVPPEPRQPGLGNARPGDVIRSVTTTRKLIALTFDDGPSKDALPKILAALASVRAQGTFFEVGDRSIGHGDLLREIVASGSELGDHSWDHQEVDKVASTSAIERSISRTQQRMLDVTGVTPVLFRPPAGHYDGRLPGIAASDGLAVALWSLHSGDTNGDSAAKITRTVLGGARPGAIVLMHETAPHTVEALPGIVRALKARGYRMVTVSRLLAAGEPR
jgi:peptidoglycan-N-acetylglucosamine deacetylase